MLSLFFELPDLIEPRMLTLFDKASSLILANIKIDMLDEIDQLEVKNDYSGVLLFITKSMLCAIQNLSIVWQNKIPNLSFRLNKMCHDSLIHFYSSPPLCILQFTIPTIFITVCVDILLVLFEHKHQYMVLWNPHVLAIMTIYFVSHILLYVWIFSTSSELVALSWHYLQFFVIGIPFPYPGSFIRGSIDFIWQIQGKISWNS